MVDTSSFLSSFFQYLLNIENSITYVLYGYTHIEVGLALCFHIFFIYLLISRLTLPSGRLPLLLLAQIPLLIFPLYRAFWSLRLAHPGTFVCINMLTLGCAFAFLHKTKAQGPKDIHPLLIIFLCTTIVSVCGSQNFTISAISALYLTAALLLFNTTFNTMRSDKQLIVTSLYCFFMGSLVMMAYFLTAYMLRYGIPLSLHQIYLNKIELSAKYYINFKICGNIHNVVPFIVLVNILAAFFMVLCTRRREEFTLIKQSLCTTALSMHTLLFFNLLASLSLLFLYMVRGPMFFILATYITLLIVYIRQHKPRPRTLLLIFPICLMPLLFAGGKIKHYFTAVFVFFYESLSHYLINTTIPEAAREVSISGRLDSLLKGLQIIKENPLLGVGLENYLHVEKMYTSPHNFIVQHIAELGIFGLIFLVALGVYFVRELRTQKNEFLFCLLFSTSAFCLYMTLLGGQLFNSGLLLNGITLFYLLYVYDSLKKHLPLHKDTPETLRQPESARGSDPSPEPA